MTDILAALRDITIRKEACSEQYKKLREDSARARGQDAKAIITGKQPEVSGLPQQAAALRKHYYDMLSIYKGGSFAFAKPLTKRSTKLWLRVYAAWKDSGVEPEQYIRAQFDWFNKAFGKAPTVEQLTTPLATQRAIDSSPLNHNIVGNNVSAKVDTASIFRESERMVQDIMRAQGCSREEFYKNFVLTGVFSLPPVFLNADPVYRKLTNV